VLICAVRCAQCHRGHGAVLREAEVEDLEKEKPFIAPYVCDNCRTQMLGVTNSPICGHCRRHNKSNKWHAAARWVPYLKNKALGLTRICAGCYTAARRAKERGVVGSEPLEGEMAPTSQSQAVGGKELIGPTDNTGLPSEVVSAELEWRFRRLLAQPYDGRVVEDLEEYRAHVNSIAEGLFDIFFRNISPIWTRVNGLLRTAILIEQYAHNMYPRHSGTMWELSDLLFLSGMSLEKRIELFGLGFGMHPSHLIARIPGQIEAYQSDQRAGLKRRDRVIMVTMDDKSGHWTSPLLTEASTFSEHATVGTVCWKDISDSGLNPTVGAGKRSPMYPARFDAEAVVKVLTAFLEEKDSQISYMALRAPAMEELSAVTVPYGHQRRGAAGMGVNLDNTVLYRCFGEGYKTKDEICSVMRQIATDMAEYSFHHYALTTGDWYTFWYMVCMRRAYPELFWWWLPTPGQFHIGLNAQDAVFATYAGVIKLLWKAAYGEVAFPVMKRPLQRKHLLCRAWKTVRTECLIEYDCRKRSYELITLHQLFEEHLPVCLDLYASFLNGDFDSYMALLLRGLRMFMQLGKVHYTKVCLVFIALIEHWRQYQPDLYEAYRKSHHLTSEEEIELFHSTITQYADEKITAEGFAMKVNFHAATKRMQAAYETATGIEKRSGGWCVEHNSEALGAVAGGIRDLFRAASSLQSGCAPTEDGREWTSEMTQIGDIPDAALPMSLQQCPAALGFMKISLREWKTPLGSAVVSRTHLCCGHRMRKGCVSCPECSEMLREKYCFSSSVIWIGL